MTYHRRLAAVAAVGLASVALTGLTGAPASAHGALDNPVSRAVECASGGQASLSAACKAVVAARGTGSFTDWDNIRVAGVQGRDRQLIPDGRLCSGGIAAYAGLDRPRADWPATMLPTGTDFTFTYRETIPHKGTFRLYVTKDGYQPTQPLTWADLEEQPFLNVTDPPHRDRAYVIDGKLPAAKAGRHLIYTIWQNSDTPDTYYSCSDVFFTGAPPTNAQPPVEQPSPGTPTEAPDAEPSASDSPSALPSASSAAPSKASSSSRLSDTDDRSYVLPAGAGVAVLLLAAAALFLYRRRRPATHGRHR